MRIGSSSSYLSVECDSLCMVKSLNLDFLRFKLKKLRRQIVVCYQIIIITILTVNKDLLETEKINENYSYLCT